MLAVVVDRTDLSWPLPVAMTMRPQLACIPAPRPAEARVETIRVAIVIPYFQREAGILARALRSIADQRFTADVSVHVLVVDDQSPQPPEPDCAAVTFPHCTSVTVIKRPNGGPGAARNSGLDALADDTDFVALLDSDDIWQPGHLQYAIDSLGTESDFYFCDHRPAGSASSYFENLCKEAGPQASLHRGLLLGRAAVSETEDRQIYMDGKVATLALVSRYLAHTSTIVVRRRTLGDIRFVPTLRFAGEDYLFTLQLAQRARKTCCSQWIGVQRGRGIDLYESCVSWSHADHIKVVLDNLKSFIIAKNLFKNDSDLHVAILNRIRVHRTEFLWVCVRRLVFSGRIDRRIIKAAYREDATLLRVAPALLTRACMAKLRGRRVIDIH